MVYIVAFYCFNNGFTIYPYCFTYLAIRRVTPAT